MELAKSEGIGDLWHTLIEGLGVLRWQPSYEQLLGMVPTLDKSKRRVVVLSAIRIPEQAAPLLALVSSITMLLDKEEQRWALQRLGDAITGVADASFADELLGLTIAENDWFFERISFAKAYLTATRLDGVRTLLKSVNECNGSPLISIPLMAAVADYLASGREVHHVADDLIRLARIRHLLPQVLWLVTECLDHLPPQLVKDDFVFRKASGIGSLGVAITRLKWGDRTQLKTIQKALKDPPWDLIYSIESHSWHMSFRVGERLIPTLVQYSREWLVEELKSLPPDDRTSPFALDPVVRSLLLADMDAGLLQLKNEIARGPRYDDAYVAALSPLAVTPASILTVMSIVETVAVSRRENDGFLTYLLNTVAGVADDTNTVERMHALFLEYPKNARLYDALSEVAQRAKVRVMADGVVVAQ